MLMTGGSAVGNAFFRPNEDKEYKFCRIQLIPSLKDIEICGKITLSPKPGDNRSRVSCQDQVRYYGK